MLAFWSQAGVNVLVLVIAVVTLGLKVWALVDCVTRRPDAFVAAGKLTKTKWLAILGVALVLALVIFDPLSLLNIVGIVAAAVYLADVRPAVRSLGGGRGGGGGGGYGW